MKSKSTAVRLWLSFLICCSAFSTLSAGQAVANKQSVLSQARQAYYNLRNEGLVSFECTVTPNWETLLADQRKSDPDQADANIHVLSQIHFNAAIGADGKVKLTHDELSEQSKGSADPDALKRIYSDMEQMTSGFFDIWSLFMLNTPFPEVSGDYGLQAVGQQYRLTYRDGLADVVTTMGRDFAMNDLKITTTEFDSDLQPQFTKSPKGFLFSAYDTTYQTKNPGEATQLKVRIGYQEVEGLELLQKLDLSGSYGGNSFAVQLSFSDCKVTKKQ